MEENLAGLIMEEIHDHLKKRGFLADRGGDLEIAYSGDPRKVSPGLSVEIITERFDESGRTGAVVNLNIEVNDGTRAVAVAKFIAIVRYQGDGAESSDGGIISISPAEALGEALLEL